MFFFSIIAYLVLSIISSIFSAHLVGFAIAGELILTGNFSSYYYMSYFLNEEEIKHLLEISNIILNQGSVHKHWAKQYIPGTLAQSLCGTPDQSLKEAWIIQKQTILCMKAPSLSSLVPDKQCCYIIKRGSLPHFP